MPNVGGTGGVGSAFAVLGPRLDLPGDSNIHFSKISGNPTIRYAGRGVTEWTGGSGLAELSILQRSEV